MTRLFRLLLVCLIALFAAPVAQACAHASQAADVSHVVLARGECHGVVMGADHHSNAACHASCCVIGCAFHCAAPPVEARFDVPPGGAPTPPVVPDPSRAGITHAPLLPPPIV
jgi:hypothetical protein